MKYLVSFYSRTGVTRKVAEAISSELGCDREEIFDTKNRSGAIGYAVACKDAVLKKSTEIKKPEKDLSLYDVLIIGTPVWALTMAPAVKAYIMENKDRFKHIAFFCTQGSAGSKMAFKDMQELCNEKPLALLEFTAKEAIKGGYTQKIKEFIGGIVKDKSNIVSTLI